MKQSLKIRPLEPVMLRDGRPFDASPGAKAHSMNEVPPSVVAGTIRTLLGKRLTKENGDTTGFGEKVKLEVAKLVVRGPLLHYKGQPYFTVPRDLHFRRAENGLEADKIVPRKPEEGEGFLGTGRSGWHGDRLWPAAGARGKAAAQAPQYLSAECMVDWLQTHKLTENWLQPLNNWYTGNATCPSKNDHYGSICSEEAVAEPFLHSFPRDVRTHVSIDTASRTSMEGILFDTEALVFPEDAYLLAEADLSESDIVWPKGLSAIHSFGGKRRLAHFSEIEASDVWSCPETILQALDGAGYIRMVLATPAYFTKGWLPGWLDSDLRGKPEAVGEEDIVLELKWACVPRWQPISGWSYGKREEKAVRRMVPAGSVYFFKVERGNPRLLAEKLWLQSVSDRNRRTAMHDRNDGFGLSLWGIWDEKS
ncbi:type III-B CRISPR module-associated protein Cmr3 [Marinicrinis lubricantis]|uniref:Type III-B CRISPR module-associated protein Cmr3 n=1 Tax=Marinicrinis lubricantis TaxID=2086470 RepID=A0ABW1IN88_9BACL